MNAIPADKRNIAIIGNTSNKECGCNRLIWLHGIDNMWLLGNTAAVGTRPGPYIDTTDVTDFLEGGNVFVP